MADPASPDDPLDEAFAAYLRSCDAGQLTSREAFLAQFPDLSEQLKELMEVADLLGRVTTGGSDSANARDDSSGGVQLGSAVDAEAETVQLQNVGGDGSAQALAETMASDPRPASESGPSLPFDLGDYRLLRVLGRGGMGVVYLAQQIHLERQVAVKMIRSGVFADSSEVQRFYAEAQAAARLRHPGLVTVHQFGQQAGHHFFSMQYIEGDDLQRVIGNSVLDFQTAARYVRDVARATQHAHENGILHRDLKPANVLIDRDDQVHVTDFGLAKHLDSDSSVTRSGAAIGTPHYMAPEQAAGQPDRVGRHTDVYALGAVLFACLTGRPPIVADTVMQTLIQVIHQPVPPLCSIRPETPADLETIVAKCLEKDPEDRYASAEELADELEAFLRGRPIAARPRSGAVRLWHWLQGVPLVGALTGRRAVETSPVHRRFQAGMLSLLALTPLMLAAVWLLWQYQANQMPSHVQLAGGLDGGMYTDVATALAQRLEKTHGVRASSTPSGGSLDNQHRLLSGEVHLAPMQASAIRGDTLSVVAPLYYETVHVLARDDSTVRSLSDLAGQAVAVGPRGGGSQLAAELVFQSLNLAPEVTPRREIAWSALSSPTEMQGGPAGPEVPVAAVICIGRGSPLVSRWLASGRWRLVPIAGSISIALQHPTLRPMTIEPADYPAAGLPAGGVPTVGTTAFLAARYDAPSELVTAALGALYDPPLPIAGLISREQAAEWQGLVLHPAARRYFAQFSGDD